jgi:hypothetical protein
MSEDTRLVVQILIRGFKMIIALLEAEVKRKQSA